MGPFAGLMKRAARRARDLIIPPVLTEISAEQWSRERAASAYFDEGIANFCAARSLSTARAGHVFEPSVAQLALAVQTEGARILDFGGGCGGHAALLRRLSPRRVDRYIVVETAQMIASAKAHGLNSVHFSETIPDEPFDVAFSSGALQYVDEPLEALAKIVSVGAPSLLLARNVFSDRTRYFQQSTTLFEHGAGEIPTGLSDRPVKHYLQALPFERVKDIIGGRYEIILMTENNTGIPGGAPNVHGCDLLCRLR
jgi:putative methyltransferase (TIGR04325 family)